MKNLIITTSAILLVLNNLNAQNNGDIEVGANLGLSLAGVSVSNGENKTDDRVTFNAGITGEYYFSDRWGIKVKIISDNKGWSDGTITDQYYRKITTNIELHYITIPVMANWHFSEHRRWYLNFGPYVGILTHAQDSEPGTNLKDQLNSSDFGLAFGIGYKIKINENTRLYLEYDGQAGFTDIMKDNNENSVKHTRGSYNVGVLFNL